MAIAVAPAIASGSKTKIVYIDHIKVILIILVVLHHTFITYGAPGGWYYYQKTTNEVAKGIMTFFVATNQSFFMGFFFFLSAYFIPASLEKKGPAKFIKDRLVRLGIPLAFYSLVLSPVLNYIVEHYGYGRHHSFIEYMSGYHHWIDFGVLWFVAALLLFTLLYVGWDSLTNNNVSKPIPSPGLGKIMLFAAILGLISFLVRLVFPVGWVLQPVGFQLGHFTQYIALFAMGILASKNKWPDGISRKQGINARRIAALFGVLVFILFYIMLAALRFPGSWFSGGFHLPAFLYAMWEQVTGIAIMTAFIGLGKQGLNNPSPLWSGLSRSAFAVYIFHPLVVVGIALLASPIQIDPALKLLFAAPLAVICSFLLGSLIIAVPGVKRIV
ncbi:MAG: acyltransferase [Bacteroidetes bacterium]|nr:acyltransferase [Bacteroidota bacterium]